MVEEVREKGSVDDAREVRRDEARPAEPGRSGAVAEGVAVENEGVRVMVLEGGLELGGEGGAGVVVCRVSNVGRKGAYAL